MTAPIPAPKKKPLSYRRSTCRLCDGHDLDVVLPLAPTPLVDAYIKQDRLHLKQEPIPLDLALCRTCGHVQLLDVVDPDVIYTDYLYETVSSLGLPEHFDAYAEDVLKRIKPAKDALVFDVGSNDGTLLKAFKKRGMRVLGIDPAREIAHKATANGLETVADFFSLAKAKELKAKHGPAAIVTTNNLYANIDEMHDLTEGVRHMLAADGVFVFESSYLADMIDNMVFDFIYHEHLSYFSARPVAAFFKRHGLELIDVQHTAPKGGSMRYTAQLQGGPRKAAPAVAVQLAYEEKRGLQSPATFKAWSAVIEKAKAATVAALSGFKGRKVCGYGASATTTTLIHHLGIGGQLECFFDDYPIKQNTFSPGLHIPVVPSSEIYVRKPDLIFVAAWRYAGPIMKRHEAFAKAGGKWLIPLPEMKVV
ncbi:MAG: class I SAM-dependent methyltransferase [Elusimicrobiota bacterium]